MKAQHNLQVDFLHGPILPSMIRFAVPVLFSLVFQQLYNTVDTVIIGHTLGETALAAMGSAAAVYELFLGFINGMGSGMVIMTARSWGRGDRPLVKKTVAASLVIAAVTGAVITIAALVSMRLFLTFLKTPAEVFDQAYTYVATIAAFYVVTLAYNLCSGLLRAIGNSVMPLVFLMISSVTNVVLDYVCIVYLHMGIRGAAIATVLAQILSVVLCVVYILKRVPELIPQKTHFAYEKHLYGQIVTQGISMGLMSGIVLSGTAILQSAINGLGYLVVAGHVAARKLFGLMMMLSVSMMQAANTFVSQNFGAGKIGRIRKGIKIAYLYNCIVFLSLSVMIYFAAPVLVRWISGSEEAIIIGNGTRYLRFVVPCMIALGFLNVTRTALQSIGQKILPVISSVIELIGKIAFVALFIPRFGYNAVVVCEPVIWVLMDIELLIAFWRNPVIRQGKTMENA